MKSEAIVNRDRAGQLLAFDGLSWGKLRPTDMDLSMDFGKRVFIFGEIKGGTRPLTTGQKIHLMALVDAIEKGGLKAYAFLAHHDIKDTDKDVHVAECTMARVYTSGAWYEPESTPTVLDFMNEVYEGNKRGDL
jgi:hypothetical protein